MRQQLPPRGRTLRGNKCCEGRTFEESKFRLGTMSYLSRSYPPITIRNTYYTCFMGCGSAPLFMIKERCANPEKSV